jgi:predicted DNA-binding transcriptional regulator AlpA
MNDLILTIKDVAKLLKMKPTQVYTLTRRRSQVRMGGDAIPFFKINGNIRFSANSVSQWLAKLSGVKEVA